jgi:thiol:disulfide interchange protein
MSRMKRRLVPALMSLTVLAPWGPVLGQENGVPDFYVVADYEEARDPASDLAVAVERAQREGKRILIQVGGEWCVWCHRLDAYLTEHPAIRQMLAESFLVMKVNWSPGNQNQDFLGQYPPIHGYPHLFVLEEDGTFLHSQDTAELEEGPSYNEGAVLALLERWKPAPRG